jgi:quinol monooxygenase YgiN
MTLVLCAKWTARAGEEEAVLAALQRLAGPTREEPGCLMWQPHRDPEDARVFFVYEQYVDQAAVEAHVSSEHFQQHGAGDAVPRLESRERTFYDMLEF